MNSVYLAGPIQHAADHGKGWRSRLTDGDIDHEGDIKWVDPMDKYNTHELEYKEWTEEEIIREDLEIISESDAVLVHWLEVPTCGTPMEVFFAHWFPQFATVIKDLAVQLRNAKMAKNEDYFIREAFEDTELPHWMFQATLAINEEVPVIVQTNVPEEEISPWLTGHADAVVPSFSDAAHWIENEIGAGDAPEPELVDAEYDVKVA